MKRLIKNDRPVSYSRKKFISDSLMIIGGATLMPSSVFADNFLGLHQQYTVQQIIDIILKEIPGAPYSTTVDTIKSGSPDQAVSGIVTTMFATIDIIRQTKKLGANFIIAHEPTFYNHTDDKNWVKENDVLKQKQELLDKEKIAVWRFHDYCHAIKPEPMRYAIAKNANWLSYYKQEERIIQVPPITLEKLAAHLKSSLGIKQVKVIGDLSQSCERIALMPGASGGQSHLNMVESQNPDVLIVGELHEWETAEYIRDGKLFGSKTALIILGHSVSEEPGMEWIVEWLQPKVAGVKITHLASGDPFTWL